MELLDFRNLLTRELTDKACFLLSKFEGRLYRSFELCQIFRIFYTSYNEADVSSDERRRQNDHINDWIDSILLDSYGSDSRCRISIYSMATIDHIWYWSACRHISRQGIGQEEISQKAPLQGLSAFRKNYMSYNRR